MVWNKKIIFLGVQFGAISDRLNFKKNKLPDSNTKWLKFFYGDFLLKAFQTLSTISKVSQ